VRLKIKIHHPKNLYIVLPCHYNELVQGFIYRHLDDYFAKKLHDYGFEDLNSKRRLKLFTFSRLIPDDKAQIRNGKIYLYGSINLIVSSPVHEFIQSLALNLLKSGTIKLDNENLDLLSVEVEGTPIYKEKIYIKTLSPITVYSTFITMDGKKKTYYYSPFEKEFEELLIKNLLRKLRIWHGFEMKAKDYFAEIKPFKVRSKDQKIIMYKNTVIKGWDGIFEMSLHPELFALAFDAGLGAKNSLGFGCIEVWEEKNK